MSKILYLYSHNELSSGAKELSKHLLIKRIRHSDSKFKGNARKIVINWGASEIPYQISLCNVLNRPECIQHVTNKLSFFRTLKGASLTPSFTTNKEEAKQWIEKGTRVVCRTLLNASEGRGIVLASKASELVEAPLYVSYVPKKDEYRVHIFDGEVIDVQKKVWKREHPNPNWEIRNHRNGFIYTRTDLNPPEAVQEVAQLAFSAFSIDFGAVDVIWTENKKRALALEINTAPGLEGQTIVSYANALKERLRCV